MIGLYPRLRKHYLSARRTTPDWIPYDLAEDALFRALQPELKLIAADHAYHFGAEVANMAKEVAEAAYPKAVAILHKIGHHRVFGNEHLWAKVYKWATWWC